MPLYEYECKQCHKRVEKIQSFSAPEITVCPTCGGELERVISAPAIQFKGAGWYVNDYAAKKPGAKSGGESKSDGGGASSDSASTTSSDSSSSEKSGSSGSSESASSSTPAASPSTASAAPASSKN